MHSVQCNTGIKLHCPDREVASGANDAKNARLEKEVEELRPQFIVPGHRGCTPNKGHSQSRTCWRYQLQQVPLLGRRGQAVEAQNKTASKTIRRGTRAAACSEKFLEDKGAGKGKGVMNFERDHGHVESDQGVIHISPLAQRVVLQVSERVNANDASVCGRKHSCRRLCSAEGKPYNFCHCLQSTAQQVRFVY